MNLELPNELELDALREVANIGCGQAANALSRLVGDRQVVIDVPHVRVAPVEVVVESLGGAQSKVMAAGLELTSGLSGWLLMVLSEADAVRLCSLLLGSPSQTQLSEQERDAFAEAANVVGSACLSAIGSLTGLRLVPSVPRVARLAASEVMGQFLGPEGGLGKSVLVMEARFIASHSPPIEGRILVLPDEPSLGTLLGRLGV